MGRHGLRLRSNWQRQDLYDDGFEATGPGRRAGKWEAHVVEAANRRAQLGGGRRLRQCVPNELRAGRRTDHNGGQGHLQTNQPGRSQVTLGKRQSVLGLLLLPRDLQRHRAGPTQPRREARRRAGHLGSQRRPLLTQNEFFTKGEIEASTACIQDVLDKIKTGEANRQYARTYMNHKSSRSHSIFKIKLRSVANVHSMQTVRESILVSSKSSRTSSTLPAARNSPSTSRPNLRHPRSTPFRMRATRRRAGSPRPSTSTRASSS